MNELEELKAFNAEGEEAPVEQDSNITVEPSPVVEDLKKKGNAKKRTVAEQAVAVIPKVPEIPAPQGGVGIMLAVCLLFVLAITSAPGQSISRLALIWKAFLGTAILGDGSSSASGGSAPQATGNAGASDWNPYHIAPPEVVPGSAWNPYGIY